MYPILFQMDGVVLPAWHAMYALAGIFAWLIYSSSLRKSDQIAEGDIRGLFAVVYIAGYLGARSLSILVEEQTQGSLLEFGARLLQFGAMTFYGGAILGFLAGLAFVFIRRLPVGILFDAGLPAALVALGVGRIGCFLNGDDFGKAVPSGEHWWTVTFPNLQDGIPRYPVQLWEAFFGILFGIGLVRLTPLIQKYIRPGGVGSVGVAVYSVFRFWNEKYRGDFRGWILEGKLSTSQGIAVFLFLLVLGLIPLWLRKPKSSLPPVGQS